MKMKEEREEGEGKVKEEIKRLKRHIESEREGSKRYYRKHREKVLKRTHEYYMQNRDKILEYHRKYQKKQP